MFKIKNNKLKLRLVAHCEFVNIHIEKTKKMCYYINEDSYENIDYVSEPLKNGGMMIK